MTEKFEQEALDKFGKAFIRKARDLTILEEFRRIEGEGKGVISKKIYENLKDFSSEQRLAIKKLVVDAIDGALDNFLWLLEESDEFELVAYHEDKTLPLKNISDGLSVDYWNFVDSELLTS
ncbi:MAG TPA: hypothetical protein PLY23_09020 [Alphaproteobacteria bacterium]|nr:hypothetical protein [Alphaproteobacteria bacterium]HQS94746.1 hypothetical protein [Alphaproteobacteria bacterium]